MKPITDIDDPRYLKALAHPLRIRILAMLSERAASPVQLAAKLDATLGTVAYHVRTLHTLGLLELVDTRQRRGATEHYYRAHGRPRFVDDAWGGLLPADKQRMISALLRQIGEFVSASAAAGGFDRSDSRSLRTSFRLDEQGWEELARATHAWQREAAEIADAAARRLEERNGADADGDRPAGTIDAGLIMMLFEALPFSDHPPDSGPTGGGGSRRRTARQTAKRG